MDTIQNRCFHSLLLYDKWTSLYLTFETFGTSAVGTRRDGSVSLSNIRQDREERYGEVKEDVVDSGSPLGTGVWDNRGTRTRRYSEILLLLANND